MPNPDYPRMMFHDSKDAVVIHSADEETALGPEWRRTILPAAAARPATPALEPGGPADQVEALHRAVQARKEPEEPEPEEPKRKRKH